MNSGQDHLAVGFPHSDICGSTIARISPQLIAACHVLHRLLVPRHPPNALYCLILSFPSAPVARGGNPRATPSPFRQGRRRFEFSSRHDDATRNRLRGNQHHRRTLFTISNNLIPKDRTADAQGRAECLRTICRSQRQHRWWRRTGLNRRPPACKAGALPLSYAPGPLCSRAEQTGGPGKI